MFLHHAHGQLVHIALSLLFKQIFTMNANLEEILTDGDPDIHREIDN